VHLSAQKNANTVFYEGQVVDYCSGEPLEGVEVRFWGNSQGETPGAYTTTTDANGEYASLLFGYDTWIVTVSEPSGPTTPGQYYFTSSQGNQSNLDFELLPGDWEVEINGDPISPLNTSFSPLVICKGQESCIDINSEFKERYGSNENIVYCFRGRAYRTDLAGQKLELLAESPCITVGDQEGEETPPCGSGVDLSQALGQIEEIPGEGLLLLIEVEQFCCNEECQPAPESFTNTQEFFVRLQEELDFDFEISASSQVETANVNTPGNTDLNDLVVPRSETLPGTTVGASSFGVIITDDTEREKIDGFRVIIEEVNCNDGTPVITLYDEEFEEQDFPSGPLLFTSELVGPPGQEILGYFPLNSGLSGESATDGKCYKLTVIAESECGPLEQFSYFNILQGCPFCLQDGGGQTANIEADHSLQVEAFPLPATSTLNVQASQIEEGPIELSLLSSTGQVLQNMKDAQASKGFNHYEIDVSTCPPGLYLLSISNSQQRITRKIIVE
jgi:hypothetical protein